MLSDEKYRLYDKGEKTFDKEYTLLSNIYKKKNHKHILLCMPFYVLSSIDTDIVSTTIYHIQQIIFTLSVKLYLLTGKEIRKKYEKIRIYVIPCHNMFLF